MMDRFPYGKAALCILLLALGTGAIRMIVNHQRAGQQYDLTLAVFAKMHHDAYQKVIPEFEKKHGVKVNLQLVNSRSLTSRLQSAMQSGSKVPDMVEIVNGSMGYFTRGPLEDVGFVDLTDRLKNEKIDNKRLYDEFVESRFSIWSSRDHIFALPHDVHPVALCYRRDIVEKLGIKVEELTTWDKFVEVGQKITKDLDGDGNPDRYMFDLQYGGSQLRTLLLQRGLSVFGKDGKVAMDDPRTVDTIIWYLRQTRSDKKIAYDAGWGQGLSKVMLDGLVLFYICPDWRTMFFQQDVPKLAGKLALMPMPAWKEGGRRTSTWGGTGLCITKACKNQKLAWEFAKFLYLQKEELGKRFGGTNIIPPVKSAWDLPEFDKPSQFYFDHKPAWSKEVVDKDGKKHIQFSDDGQKLGRLYAELAPHTPDDYVSPYMELGLNKLSEAYLSSAEYYEKNGEKGLKEFVAKEVTRCAKYVERVMARNVFLKKGSK